MKPSQLLFFSFARNKRGSILVIISKTKCVVRPTGRSTSIEHRTWNLQNIEPSEHRVIGALTVNRATCRCFLS